MSKSNRIIPNDPNLSDLEKAAVRAARDFDDAEKVIDMFKIENSAVLKIYQELLDDREQKRQVADAAIRATGKSISQWDAFSENKRYYPEKLYEAVGREAFLKMGGKISTVQQYEIEGQAIDLAISKKEIPEALAAEVKKVTLKYRSPDES